MSKQEQIRKVIDDYADDTCLYPEQGCEFCLHGFCVSEDVYKCLMKRLGELGVVVKVEKEFPSVSTEFGSLKLAGQMLDDMLDAGAVFVEELRTER